MRPVGPVTPAGPATGRAAGLVLGLLADQLVGDPGRWHPVAGIGRVAAALERRTYADTTAAGARHLAVVAIPPIVLARVVEQRCSRRPLLHVLLTAAAVWSATGARQLGQLGTEVHDRLSSGDLDGARSLMPSLVGRDPAELTAADMARATIESIAENTSDALAGPVVWLALAGVPGVVAHRVVNTLDAMVGHRTPRLRRFGTAAARADDLLGLIPARATAGAIVLLAPLVGGSRAVALATWRRDAARHPSPNAGPVEAAAAGALGLTLGGPTRYGERVELRGPLGSGPAPTVADIPRAVHLARAVGLGLAAAALAAIAAQRGRRG